MKKNFKNLSLILILALGSHTAYAADTGLSASSLKMKIFKFAVSTNVLCTNLITVVDNGNSPVELDLVGVVQFGKGKIPKGTYPCVVIEFEDHIKFKPSTLSSHGTCNPANPDEVLDVCRTGAQHSTLIDGTSTTCSAASDRLAMYLSTTAAGGNSADAFNPPTVTGDSAHGFPLTSALVVTGSSVGKFVVNPTGKVCDAWAAGCDGGGGGATACKLEPPVFGFSQN
jgi:hypothetical protein